MLTYCHESDDDDDDKPTGIEDGEDHGRSQPTSQQGSTFFKMLREAMGLLCDEPPFSNSLRGRPWGQGLRAQFSTMHRPWRRFKTLLLHVTLFFSLHITYRNRDS